MTGKLLALVVGASVGMFPGPREDSIAAAIEAWGPSWCWGLQACDVDSDGIDDLVITDHNGGSIVLRSNGDGSFVWVDVGNQLGGTFRPAVFDFDGDGHSDLLYRDSKPTTAYRSTGEGFTNVAFAYGTDNDPVRNFGTGWFGHDFERWQWDGSTFKAQGYINPAFLKLPFEWQVIHWANEAQSGKFYRAWFNEIPGLVCFSGFWNYSGPLYSRFFWSRRGKLIDVTAKLGLPTDGAVCYADADCIMIIGHGLYTPAGNKYAKVPGQLTDFLAATVTDAPHQVFLADDRVVVSNVRGLATKIFKRGGDWSLLHSTGSWEEGACVGDFNGDGIKDVAIGSENSVKFFYGN